MLRGGEGRWWVASGGRMGVLSEKADTMVLQGARVPSRIVSDLVPGSLRDSLT